jgi:pimeloyl-ACP methyl ester carboxylesterase
MKARERRRDRDGRMIRLARFGSFTVGGRQIRVEGEAPREVRFTNTAAIRYDPNGLFHVEQAYVQYFVPDSPASELPVLLVHGGGLTGAMWETTPDGRPGWAELFLRRGFPVYVIDNVERGRAGWCPFRGIWPDEPIVRSAEEAWWLFRFGREEDFAARTPFPGQRFPVAAAFDGLIRLGVPRWTGNNDAAVAALIAAVREIGPVALIAHSHGGEIALRSAMALPDLVRAVVAIEPSGFPDVPNARTAGGRRFLFVIGDYLDRYPLWISLDGRIRGFAADLAAAGGRVERWDMPSRGIRGNSHMMMMDDNNETIAALIGDWLLLDEKEGNDR